MWCGVVWCDVVWCEVMWCDVMTWGYKLLLSCPAGSTGSSSPQLSPHLTVVRLRGSSVPPPNLPPTSTSTSTVTGTGTYLGTSRDIWGHRPPTTKLDWFNKSRDSKVNSKYSPAGGQKALFVSTINWDQRVNPVSSNPRLGDRWRQAFNKENPYCLFSIFIAISLLWWIIKGE